jgi:hypothetical protein
MDRASYTAMTGELCDRLVSDERVVGLVALGSMAERDYEPDRWSDHDFFVIVHEPWAEAMRRDVGWLPRPEQITLALRETAHGSKVVYDDGHLVEFAVFTLAEVGLAKVSRYRVLIDRGGVEEAVAAISGEMQPRHVVELRYELGMLATNVLVGVGRHRRGEQLSAHQFVAGHALGHLLRALTAMPSPDVGLLDGLDPRRRFERVHPAIGAELGALLTRPLPELALGLLAVARRELGDRSPDDVLVTMAVIERLITAS